jgi:hypothetical protein
MKLLVPLYDLSYAPRVLAAAKRKPIAVIANIVDGPGLKPDKLWVKLIRDLVAAKAEVFGYIDLKDTDSHIRSKPDINADTVRWEQFYGVRSFFYDDWDFETIKPAITAGCIANPGWDTPTTFPITVIHETAGWCNVPVDERAGGSVVHRAKGPCAAIAMAERDFAKPLAHARRHKLAYFYAVATRDTLKAYDTLPPYFEALAAAV